jgi:hypothetical protein
MSPRFIQLNTIQNPLTILYNTIHEIALNPVKNRVEIFLAHGLIYQCLGSKIINKPIQTNRIEFRQ